MTIATRNILIVQEKLLICVEDDEFMTQEKEVQPLFKCIHIFQSSWSILIL